MDDPVSPEDECVSDNMEHRWKYVDIRFSDQKNEIRMYECVVCGMQASSIVTAGGAHKPPVADTSCTQYLLTRVMER
jgi:hypothetical protein